MQAVSKQIQFIFHFTKTDVVVQVLKYDHFYNGKHTIQVLQV